MRVSSSLVRRAIFVPRRGGPQLSHAAPRKQLQNIRRYYGTGAAADGGDQATATQRDAGAGTSTHDQSEQQMTERRVETTHERG